MMSSEFYLSPLKFALWCYSWGEGDLKRFNGPRRWQREVMLEMEEYLKDAHTQKRIFDKFPDYFREAVASGRGPGKSALIGMLSHWFVSTRIGSSTWVAANGEPQLRTKTFPEIAKWVARGINSDFFEVTSTMILPSKWFKEYIESPQGLGRSTRYYYIAGQLWSAENPDAFAGAHNYDGEFAIFDEASGIPEPIWTVQEGVFTEDIPDRFWLAFSNPRSNTGAFYDCFHKNKEQWRTRQIDSRSVEGISHAPFESIIQKYGEDSDEAKVEVYGQFPSVGDDQFISPKMVDDALLRDPVVEPGAKIIIGVDVARFGGDSSAIIVRKGRTLVKCYTYKSLDTMQVVGKVIEAIREWRPDMTIVDEGGLGSGVLDRLTEQGFNVRGVAFGGRADNPVAYFNKRAEMWGLMREWLRTASIGSMEDNGERDNKALKAQLCAPKYEVSSSGAIQLESKQKMKKRGVASPDEADALAVTFAYPVGDGVLLTNRFRLWPQGKDVPSLHYIVQSYDGAYTDKTSGNASAGTVWGVFEWSGDRCVMLLDTWNEKMSYPTMRDKIIKEWHAQYGGSKTDPLNRPRKAEVALVGAEGAGDSMMLDLRSANIVVPRYPLGDSNVVERAHQSAPVLETRCVYVPEGKNKGQPVSWARALYDQCDRFPNDDSELVSSMTRALLYVRDSGLLEMPQADLDDEPYEKDYHKEKGKYSNPYTM